jgi:hypothetical protein
MYYSGLILVGASFSPLKGISKLFGTGERRMNKLFEPFIAFAIMLSILVVPAQSQNKPKPDLKQLVANRIVDDGAPNVGDIAPLFKLDLKFDDFDNEKSIDLKEQIGKHPIILIFGSYT